MKKSGRKSGFVVPFARNFQTEENDTSISGDEHMIEKQSKSFRKTVPSTCIAEEILQLVTNDTDQEQNELASTSNPVKPFKLLPLQLPKALPNCKRKLSDIEEDESRAVLSSEQISIMNRSEKVPILPSGSTYYSVLWCKRSMKKHKKWEGDAILIISGRSAVLKDLEGKVIASAIGYKIKDIVDLDEGSKFFIGGKECEIQHQVEEADFLTGRCFQTYVESIPSSVSNCNYSN